ncbi:4-hydroxy-3-methylbut-2-enyl diphosphate reductase [Lipingzhangella halophila]|uniref:4-hydroxy-3-methylbut-2-enyl diphosphate reductase n=1 Tax=Lipingzhangella halophila TaxID=1783352 RepID=A0A7W7W5R1_9ACTN|nr:4-hydroxy-3-methylbut-2-enyl diphosphate reductase [Lipingzhangella halophila]MBB4935041.1 4-hydroxy-3-methylbut-2-enyl diphosphate reductase [Lipingzhangella halophila]
MSGTGDNDMTAAYEPDPQRTAMVTVADELIDPARSPIECPAAPLLAGELTRRGVPTAFGPLHLDGPAEEATGTSVLTALLPAPGRRIGLGVAASGGESGGQRAARAALADLLPMVRPRTVLLAAPRSFCAGVERAIEAVERALGQWGAPLYVRKQIVHNTHVVADLEARGAVFVEDLEEVPDGARVIFSAHGVSPAVHAEAGRRGLRVIDATCPLVTKVHTEARRFAGRGDTVVLIGHDGHEEVEGTMGEAPEHTVLVESPDDVADLEVPDPERVSYLTQTTLAVDETNAVIQALRERFPALRGPGSDDICYATTNRQDALRDIAEESDLVLVVGSGNSSNSVRLMELADRCGTPAYLVDTIGDIRPEWLLDAGVVGLTAGASAPPRLVEDVIAALGGLGPITVTEREAARETLQFQLPPAVR